MLFSKCTITETYISHSQLLEQNWENWNFIDVNFKVPWLNTIYMFFMTVIFKNILREGRLTLQGIQMMKYIQTRNICEQTCMKKIIGYTKPSDQWKFWKRMLFAWVWMFYKKRSAKEIPPSWKNQEFQTPLQEILDVIRRNPYICLDFYQFQTFDIEIEVV